MWYKYVVQVDMSVFILFLRSNTAFKRFQKQKWSYINFKKSFEEHQQDIKEMKLEEYNRS